MPINKIKIKNYKSLEDFSLILRDFMVFVGPNNSGKTNIMDCFQFLGELVSFGLRPPTIERGGFDQIVFNCDVARIITFDIEGYVKLGHEKHSFRYVLELSGDGYGNSFNNKECFYVLEVDRERKHLEYTREGGMATVWDEKGKMIGQGGAGYDKSYLTSFTEKDRYPILAQFTTEVRNWSFFNLLPPEMRSAFPVKRELRLDAFGKNLAVVLHNLQTSYAKNFREIEEILRAAIPEIDELATPLTAHEAGQTYISLREKNIQSPISSSGISDGTLRLIGYLAIIYGPDPPPLICFEEPENYIHPRLLQLLIDILRKASHKSQVFVTTHSPLLVDSLKDPLALFIVEKNLGRTRVRNAADKRGIKESLKKLGLGEMWYSGDLGGVP